MSDFLNIPGLRIGHVGSTASVDPWHCWQYTTLCERCRSLCQDCANLKQGPVTIGEGITVSGECSYCATSGASQMQIVDGAVVKCSGYSMQRAGQEVRHWIKDKRQQFAYNLGEGEQDG